MTVSGSLTVMQGKKKNASTGMVEAFVVVAEAGFEPAAFGL